MKRWDKYQIQSSAVGHQRINANQLAASLL